jgi:hypothetical protein
MGRPNHLASACRQRVPGDLPVWSVVLARRQTDQGSILVDGNLHACRLALVRRQSGFRPGLSCSAHAGFERRGVQGRCSSSAFSARKRPLPPRRARLRPAMVPVNRPAGNLHAVCDASHWQRASADIQARYDRERVQGPSGAHRSPRRLGLVREFSLFVARTPVSEGVPVRMTAGPRHFKNPRHKAGAAMLYGATRRSRAGESKGGRFFEGALPPKKVFATPGGRAGTRETGAVAGEPPFMDYWGRRGEPLFPLAAP